MSRKSKKTEYTQGSEVEENFPILTKKSTWVNADGRRLAEEGWSNFQRRKRGWRTRGGTNC